MFHMYSIIHIITELAFADSNSEDLLRCLVNENELSSDR